MNDISHNFSDSVLLNNPTQQGLKLEGGEITVSKHEVLLNNPTQQGLKPVG